MRIRTLLGHLALAASLACGANPALADSAPVRLVIGFPPGATLDVVARLLAEKMRDKLGRMVIVENRVGAGGAIANQLVKDAPADGGTLLIAPITTLTMYPHSHPDLKYDSFKDFVPVVHIARFPYALGVAAKVPAEDLATYAQLTRKDPKVGQFGSAGVGSATHYFGLMFGKAAGAEMTHIPYKGTSNVLMALQSGELSTGFVPLADMASLARSNKARVLAIVGSSRHPAFPDVPTFKEKGYDITDEGQYVMYAPRNTPKKEVDAAAAALRAALNDTEVKARFEAAYLQATGYDARRIADLMRTGYDTWGPIIRSSGFTTDK